LNEDLNSDKGPLNREVNSKQGIESSLYLAKHIPALDVCYLLLSKKDGLTPSDVSKILDLSKQTAGGYLKDLEDRGLVRIEKPESNRRERKYIVVDRTQLKRLMRQSLESPAFKSAKFKGRIYPLSVLSEKLNYQLKSLLKKRAIVEPLGEISFPSYLYVPLRVVKDRANRSFSIVLYKIDTPEDIALSLGKLILLAESGEEKKGRIFAVVIIDPSVRLWDSEVMQKAAEKHGKVKIFPEFASSDYLIRDDFAMKLAHELAKYVILS
jgi:predicted transcriptional regulator